MSKGYEVTVTEKVVTTYRVDDVKSGYEAVAKVTMFRAGAPGDHGVKEGKGVVVKTDLSKPRLVEANVDGQMSLDDVR